MNYLLLSAETDLDFYIEGIFPFTIMGHRVWFTTTHLSMILVSLTLIVLAFVVNRKMKTATDIPDGFQNAVEMVIEFIQGLVEGNMSRGEGFVNFIGMLFLFVLPANLCGLIGLRPPTADFAVTFAMGLTIFFVIQITGIRVKKFGHFKALFEPYALFFPINLVGEIANPISLSMRLFVNMLAGTIIMALWYGLMPALMRLAIPSFLHAYMDVFSGCIQTYVLCLLTAIYINDKM